MREGGITVAFLGYWQSNLPRERWAEFARQLLEEAQATPGVQSAATTTNVPLSGSSWGHGVHVGSAEGNSKFAWVSPDYFQTMGIPVTRGRGFNRNDSAASERVAVVNQAFVRLFLGGANPLGRTLRTSPEPSYPATVYEIVGVIPDTKYNDIRGDMPPMALAPASQCPNQGPWASMMIHTNGAQAAVIAAVKHRIAEKHPDVIMEFGDFQKQIRDGLLQERLMAMLSGFFGVLAAVLAMVGLYGVISYIVARRRNEIGIRLALGAERGQVVGMVMREAGKLLVIGVVVGTALSLIAGRSAGSLLFGLKPYDAFTLLAAGGLLALIAALASFVPALRAAKLDPMAALRWE
jgi:predicted permease